MWTSTRGDQGGSHQLQCQISMYTSVVHMREFTVVQKVNCTIKLTMRGWVYWISIVQFTSLAKLTLTLISLVPLHPRHWIDVMWPHHCRMVSSVAQRKWTGRFLTAGTVVRLLYWEKSIMFIILDLFCNHDPGLIYQRFYLWRVRIHPTDTEPNIWTHFYDLLFTFAWRYTMETLPIAIKMSLSSYVFPQNETHKDKAVKYQICQSIIISTILQKLSEVFLCRCV